MISLKDFIVTILFDEYIFLVYLRLKTTKYFQSKNFNNSYL